MNKFFTYIDFGKEANEFLKRCGVREQPSFGDIAELLVRSSREIWAWMNSTDDGCEKYLAVLNQIAIGYREISCNEQLVEKLKAAPILVAMKADTKYTLASANRIFIKDDATYHRDFDLLTAPIDDSLKVLYRVCYFDCFMI